MRLSHKIVLATTNRQKFEEFVHLFEAYPDVELVRADEVLRNAPKLAMVETHSTYLDNAVAKARLANHGAHYPALADDSGLEVMGLEGKPGVRSHRYAPPRAGLSQDEANVELLLKELHGRTQRQARFVSTLALCIEGLLIHGTGVLEGTILEKPRGTHGFGYDPIFQPQGSTQSLAEMTTTEKNSISHRAKALHELMSQVKAHGIVFAKP